MSWVWGAHVRVRGGAHGSPMHSSNTQVHSKVDCKDLGGFMD